MLKKVVLLALPGVAPFEFGVICEVFGIDRSETGGPAFDFTIATADPGPVRTSLGFDMIIDARPRGRGDADLIAVPAHTTSGIDERFLEVIRAAEARGAWILSVCSGAFVLAEAGILDGRRATTHWMHADRLAREYPADRGRRRRAVRAGRPGHHRARAPLPESMPRSTSCASSTAPRRPT